jgi:DNA-binding IclR family transcriptional regulator
VSDRVTLEVMARALHDIRLSTSSRLVLVVVYFAPPNTPARVIAERVGLGLSTTQRALAYLRHFGYVS